MSAKRLLLVVGALLVLALAALAVAVFFVLPRWIEREVVARASERGVQLEPGEIHFGLGWVQISDSTLKLAGVRGLSAKVGILDVDLDGFTPERFTANRVSVQASAEPLALAADLRAFMKAHAAAFREPIAIKPLQLRVQPAPQSEPVIALEDGELSMQAPSVVLRATKLRAYERDLGAVTLIAGKDVVRLGATLGSGTLAQPTLTLELRDGTTQSLHLALAPSPLATLAELAKRAVVLPRAVLSGTVDATIPADAGPLPHAEGHAAFTLKGYVPPHPIELEGFVFGDTTTLSGRFSLEPEQLKARLSELRVQAGAFAVTGSGELRYELDRFRLILSLAGRLPCTALAAAAAESRLGRALGRLSGKAAREVLAGSVGVEVAVDADPADLPHARVLKTITPGCGLRPLSLSELQALGELAPGVLDPKVLGDLDRLLKNPPSLPNLGPDTRVNLPTFDPLRLPALPLAPTSSAPSAAPSTSTGAKQPAAH